MPAGIEEARSFDAGSGCSSLQFLELTERLLQVFLIAVNPDEVLHHSLQIAMNGVRTFRAMVGKRGEQLFLSLFDLRVIDGRGGGMFGVFCASEAGATAEDQEIRKRISA